MKKDVVTRAKKVKRKKKIVKVLKIILLILLLLLLILYIAFSLIYNNGSFSITLDRNLYVKNGIIIYDDPDYKVFRTELQAETMDFIDNIKYTWLPDNLDTRSDGSHNGENYVAYTFYIETLANKSQTDLVVIDDVIKNVDEAIRIRVYKNGNSITAKHHIMELRTGTEAFLSDTLVARDHVQNFAPGDRNKYTIVIWLEGSDPECTDNILGGELKIHMDFKSEIIK